jgi:hypothetical protein
MLIGILAKKGGGGWGWQFVSCSKIANEKRANCTKHQIAWKGQNFAIKMILK